MNAIFFKFAVDDSGLYGDDSRVAKAADHELRAAQRIVDAGVANLHTPLSAVVRFCGWTVFAQSLLPGSGGGSLEYGSADAGDTVACTPRMASLMQSLASKLNLKPHQVVPRRAGATTGAATPAVLLHTAADVEGRVNGEDGRRYVLDVARLFPPAGAHSSRPAPVLPTTTVVGTHFLPLALLMCTLS